jgi:hypothetical protein
MRSKRGAFFVIVVLAVLSLCVLSEAALAFIFLSPFPSVDEQLARAPNGGTMVVNLVRPLRRVSCLSWRFCEIPFPDTST